MAIKSLGLSYENFATNTIINPTEININNDEIKQKVNEIVREVNTQNTGKADKTETEKLNEDKANKVDVYTKKELLSDGVLDSRYFQREFSLPNVDDYATKFSELRAELEKNVKANGVNLANYPKIVPEVDDTARFVRAANALNLQLTNSGAGYVISTSQPLIIPSGIYTISDEIILNGYTSVISEGKSIITQTNSDKNIFYSDVRNMEFVGINFVGGKHAVYLTNPNIDTTLINFERCEFHWQSDYAVYTWGTWEVDNHMSANLTIRKCKFIKPNGVLYNVCDSAIVEDSWVYPSRENFSPDRAVFVNKMGSLYFRNMFGVPTFGTQENGNRMEKVRWVDNYYRFYATNSRFGLEDDGIPIVYNYAGEAVNNMGGVISIKDSHANTSALWKYPESALIVLKTEVPRLIVLEGNDYVLLAPYILADPSLNLSTYFDSITDVYEKFVIKIDANLSWAEDMTSPAIPHELRRFANNGMSHNKLFPIYPVHDAQVNTDVHSYIFDIPKGYKTFTALVTFSANHNPFGSLQYRSTATFIVSMITGWNGSSIVNNLNCSPLYQPTGGLIDMPKLSIKTIGFEDWNGLDARPVADGGKFCISVDNSKADFNVTMQLIHLGG